MEPRTTFSSGPTDAVMAAPLSFRSALRYRLAQLMTEEHFEQALAEGERAHADGRILEADLRFVRRVVDSARGRGQDQPISSDIVGT